MSLIERCERISRLNRERRAQERQSSRLGAVQNHWARVKEELRQLNTELAPLRLLAKRGVLERDLPGTVAVAQTHCEVLSQQVADDTELKLDGKFFKAVEDAIGQARRDARSHVFSEWHTFVAKHAPPLRSAEVKADRNHLDPVRHKAANDLFEVLAAYEQVTAVLPKSARDFRAYENACAAVEPALKTYRRASDLPPEVEAFFQKAKSARGARLADLTPEIAAWLEANGRQDLFRIRPTNG